MNILPTGHLRFSPSDLTLFLASPYASWLDRFHLENPGILTPDQPGEDQQLIMHTGQAHEAAVLAAFRDSGQDILEVHAPDFASAHRLTLDAIESHRPLIHQAALQLTPFAGYADFLELQPQQGYRAWDAKLARSPKPTYLLQL